MTVSDVQTERQIRILSTNGTDESMAVVLNQDNNDNQTQTQRQPQTQTYYEEHKPAMLEYSHDYYARNRQTILAKKKIYNAKEQNKERSAERHRHYYQSHKEELTRKRKELRNNKNKKEK